MTEQQTRLDVLKADYDGGEPYVADDFGLKMDIADAWSSPTGARGVIGRR